MDKVLFLCYTLYRYEFAIHNSNLFHCSSFVCSFFVTLQNSKTQTMRFSIVFFSLSVVVICVQIKMNKTNGKCSHQKSNAKKWLRVMGGREINGKIKKSGWNGGEGMRPTEK